MTLDPASRSSIRRARQPRRDRLSGRETRMGRRVGGSRTFRTASAAKPSDRGTTWRDANEIGKPSIASGSSAPPLEVGYSSGDTVYRYSVDPVPEPGGVGHCAARGGTGDARRSGAALVGSTTRDSHRHSRRHASGDGRCLGPLRASLRPRLRRKRSGGWAADDRLGKDAESDGRLVSDGQFIVRVTADSEAESAIVVLERRPPRGRARTIRWMPHYVRVPGASPVRALTGLGIAPEVDTIRHRPAGSARVRDGRSRRRSSCYRRPWRSSTRCSSSICTQRTRSRRRRPSAIRSKVQRCAAGRTRWPASHARRWGTSSPCRTCCYC